MSGEQTLRRSSCRRLGAPRVVVLVAALTSVGVQHCLGALNKRGKSLARRAFVLCGNCLLAKDFFVGFCID